MNKKNTVLVSVNYLVEVSDDVLEDHGFSELEKLENKLADLSESVETELNIEWTSTHSLVLDPAIMNCGKCVNCGCWVSDKNSSEFINELSIGTIYKGKLLCDVCLPKNHELAF